MLDPPRLIAMFVDESDLLSIYDIHAPVTTFDEVVLSNPDPLCLVHPLSASNAELIILFRWYGEALLPVTKFTICSVMLRVQLFFAFS